MGNRSCCSDETRQNHELVEIRHTTPQATTFSPELAKAVRHNLQVYQPYQHEIQHDEKIRHFNSFFYQGKVNELGLPEGYGRAFLKDGSVFVGKFQNGIANSQGHYIETDGTFYRGGMRDGLFHGKGMLEQREVGRYEGDFQNGEKSGTGKFSYKSGVVYEGEYRKGIKEGTGTLTKKDGSISYRGTWANDLPNGKGTVSLPNGELKQFEWVNGLNKTMISQAH